MTYRILAALVMAACMRPAPANAAEGARAMYNRAMAQERIVRDEANKATAAQMRRVVASYEAIVRKHPASGYCDNALWQGGNLAALAYERFGHEADRKRAARLFTWLEKEYPTSKLVSSAKEAFQGLAAPARSTTSGAPTSAPAPPAPKPAAPPRPVAEPAAGLPAEAPLAVAMAKAGPVVLKEIRRSVLPDGIRITVDLDSEVAYHQEEI